MAARPHRRQEKEVPQQRIKEPRADVDASAGKGRRRVVKTHAVSQPGEFSFRAVIDDSETCKNIARAVRAIADVNMESNPLTPRREGPRSATKPDSRPPNARRAATRCQARINKLLEEIVDERDRLEEELNLTPEQREAKRHAIATYDGTGTDLLLKRLGVPPKSGE